MAAQNRKNLSDLFLDTLKDIYYAEKQILRALPKMAKAAQSDELRQAFETHRGETEGQVARLDQMFEILGKRAAGKKCPAIEGLVEEGKEVMEDFKESDALDAGLLSGAQAIEHYEISRYGTLKTWAASSACRMRRGSSTRRSPKKEGRPAADQDRRARRQQEGCLSRRRSFRVDIAPAPSAAEGAGFIRRRNFARGAATRHQKRIATMSHLPSPTRYDTMRYNRCGRSGLDLPAISLGLWHNFGGDTAFERGRAMCRAAFDLGITHFDLANNYGPPPGSAEENFGKILKLDFAGYRDELVISTKAGYTMWPGPYGDRGSRKYLLASLDQSLKRMGLDYVDIFYSHRVDPSTPMEETMGALDTAVRQGKALYVGISSYNSARTKEAAAILRSLGTPCLIHQPSYSMLNRWTEADGLLDTLEEEGIGCIAFSPLAQGMLSTKYLDGIPADSRAAAGKSLREGFINDADDRAHPRAERDRQAARPVARADGDRLGAARQARHLGADRREPHRADSGARGRAGEPEFQRGGAGGDRPPRRGERHQFVEAVQHRLSGRHRSQRAADTVKELDMITSMIWRCFSPSS